MSGIGASYYSGCPMQIEEFAALCSSFKMKYMEIQMEPPYVPSELDNRQIAALSDLLSSHSLTPIIHGPLHDVNLSSLKERMRTASVEFVKECVGLARKLNAPIAVIHAGTCPSDHVGRFLQKSKSAFTNSLGELAKHAHELGVKIGVENKQVGTDREVVLYPEEHLGFVGKFKDLGVGAVLDVGHANTTGRDLTKYASMLGGLLIELHLHDNKGVTDDHLAIGRGTVELPRLFRTLDAYGFSGPVVLELKSREDFETSIAALPSLGLKTG
ncbi:MAG: sugar phosphate isomerase/epimerase [Candidatus Thorarchaeota archaeon]|nr:sugar phosphate isomerase/epimerase [Candidatus Thorarchaeota archaeon]